MNATPEHLYDFYSTIAQVLAGAISILGAFVLFIIQSLNQKLQHRGMLFSEVFTNDFSREIQRSLDSNDYESFMRLMDKFLDMPYTMRKDLTYEQTEQQILNIQSLYFLRKKKAAIIKDLTKAVPLVGGLLLFCIIMIPGSSLYHYIPGLAYSGIAFTIAWLTGCVLFLGKIIKQAIQ
jgi:hypothetical protein